MTIRSFREDDRDALHRLTVECFENSMYVTVEQVFGPLRGATWQSRKLADVDGDLADHEGVFVAEEEGEVVGFITTQLHPKLGVGHVANLAVSPVHQGKGIGAALLRKALDRFVSAGMTHARIETLEGNMVGRHLYPKLGFREMARQIYYMMALPSQESATGEHDHE